MTTDEIMVLADAYVASAFVRDDSMPIARAALLAEVEQLTKDALRYRWLRGRVPGGTYRVMGVIYSEGGEGVDAAIDAAMQPKEALK